MKKLYIQPEMKFQPMNFVSSICLGSVRGGTVQLGNEIENPETFDPN